MRPEAANRVGWALTALAVLFLLFDGVIKLLAIAPVVESFNHLGYRAEIARTIGTLELICLAVYAIPRTALLGAVLLTGYLGGAVATHVRIGDPLFSHILFPVYVAGLVWGGLYVRNPGLRTLLPLLRG